MKARTREKIFLSYSPCSGAASCTTTLRHIVKGPLWRAFEHETTCVMLIDEIDKAPRDFPNDLLQELDNQKFPHPFSPDPRHAIRAAREWLPSWW